MRAAFTTLSFVALAGSMVSSFALAPEKGRIVQGRYLASGSAKLSGITIRYTPSRTSVTVKGIVKGTLQRVVSTRGGVVLERRRVKLRGACLSLSERGGKFTAPGRLRLSDGTVIRGSFNGLSGPDQRLSRYFRGKIVGGSNSRFILRSR